jgi:hypothetical protein
VHSLYLTRHANLYKLLISGLYQQKLLFCCTEFILSKQRKLLILILILNLPSVLGYELHVKMKILLPVYNVCDVMARDGGKCICKITTCSSSLIVHTPHKQNVLPVISM